MPHKKISRKCIFKDFPEYWYYARHLSSLQRTLVFDSLSVEEQEILTASYTVGDWGDVFFKDAITNKIEDIKNQYGYDLLDIKYKVLSGKSVYLPYKFWKIVMEEMSKYDDKNNSFVVGGIIATRCKINSDVVLLVCSSGETKD